MPFSKEDLGKYKAFKRILEEGDFKLEGKAVMLAALLFKWFYELEPLIEDAIRNVPKPQKPVKMKEKKPPIRKIGDK